MTQDLKNRQGDCTVEETKQTENGEDSLAKRPVKFIKNPLPGPKPHVKKEMNYDYEVPPDKMFFDIDKPSRNYYDLP